MMWHGVTLEINSQFRNQDEVLLVVLFSLQIVCSHGLVILDSIRSVFVISMSVARSIVYDRAATGHSSSFPFLCG